MTYINQEPGDAVRSARIMAGEIERHLRWKASVMGDLLMSSQWNASRQSQFEKWEQNVCSDIEKWQWASLGRITGAAVDEILRTIFLPLESSTIQKFVQRLIGLSAEEKLANAAARREAERELNLSLRLKQRHSIELSR